MSKSVVLIGHKSIPSRQGGVEIVVDRLATGLAARGYKVEAYNRRQKAATGSNVIYGHGDRKYYNNVRIRVIPAPGSSGYNAIVYTYLATIRALFGGYDICHFHAEGPCAMLWLLHIFRKRIIVTIHGLDWQRAKWGRIASHVIKSGEKQAARYADEIIVLSRNVQNYFRDEYSRTTHYIPNGIDIHERIEAGMIRERYSLTRGSYILFLARLVPEKGLHYLIEAFRDIRTDKKLVIAGGSGQADDYMAHITQMAGGDDRIVMTGFVQGQLLEELYSNAYLYVLPSDVEGMALSLLEAASYDNCCLVSDIPENTEVLGERCVTFKAGDVNDLRSCLQELIDDPERVNSLGPEAGEYVRASYSWDDMIDKTVEVYESSAPVTDGK